MFYKINFKADDTLSTKQIALGCPVRETTSMIVQIENPLDSVVEFKQENIKISTDLVIVNPHGFQIKPHSEVGVEVVFRPLLVKELEETLSIVSDELGEYK